MKALRNHHWGCTGHAGVRLGLPESPAPALFRYKVQILLAPERGNRRVTEFAE